MKKKKNTVKKASPDTYFRALLKEYIVTACEIEQIERELHRLAERKGKISTERAYTDEQKAALCRVIDNVCSGLVESQSGLYTKRAEAENIVSRLSSDCASILRMRYFLGLPWSSIEEEMRKRDDTYTRSKIFKLHNRAISLGDGIIEKHKCR